jgi:phage virion morphogenesis protein
MTRLSITFTSQAVQDQLRSLDRYISNLEPAYKASGEYLLRFTRSRFDNETDPAGRKWTPLKPSTIASKTKRSQGNRRKNGKARARVKAPPEAILRETNTLRDTITYQTTASSLTIGTPQEYGVFHQFGTSRMVAREFLGVNAADEVEIIEIFRDYIQKAL